MTDKPQLPQCLHTVMDGVNRQILPQVRMLQGLMTSLQEVSVPEHQGTIQEMVTFLTETINRWESLQETVQKRYDVGES